MIDLDGIDLNTVTAGAGYRLLKGFKLPDRQPQYQFRNRRIGSALLPDPAIPPAEWEIPLRVYGTSQDDVLELVGALAEKRSKIEHLAPRGGVEAELTYPDATDPSSIEVYAMEISDFTVDHTHLHRFKTDITLKLTHSPYMLGPEELLASGTKGRDVPVLETEIPDAKGDVPGPGRLVLTGGGVYPQDFVAAGLQWRDADAGTDLILMPETFDVATSPLQGSFVAGTNQVITVTPSGTITSGNWTFSLASISTGSVAHNISVAAMQALMDDLHGPGNVVVSGSPLTAGAMVFTLAGAYAGLQVNYGGNYAGLVGGTASPSSNVASEQYVQVTYRDAWTPTFRTDDQTDTGSYQLWAEVEDRGDDDNNLRIRASWSVGDTSRVKRNRSVLVGPSNDQSVWVYLGDAHIQPLAAGDHRWNVLIETMGVVTPNNQARIKRLVKLPVEHGRMRVAVPLPSEQSLVLSDDFEQSSGNATGKTPEVGTTYTGSGSATDFTIDTTNDRLQRAATSDAANTGRVLYDPTVRASSRGSLRVYLGSMVSGDKRAVVLRGTALSDYLMLRVSITGTYAFSMELVYRTASGTPVVARSLGSFNYDALSMPAYVDLDVTALDSGLCTYAATLYRSDGSLSDHKSGFAFLSALATGGALDDGRIGVYDERTAGTAGTRSCGILRGYTLSSATAALFYGRDLQWCQDGSVIRESSGGGYFAYAPGQNRTGRPLIGPAGAEALINKLVFFTARLNPAMGEIDGPQTTTWELYHRPAYLLGAHPQ